MIDREHGIKAIIVAGGIAILTGGGLFALNAGTPDQAAPAQQIQQAQEEGSQPQQADGSQQVQEEAGEGQTAYEDREIPVFRGRETDETVKLRFYEDLPNVAYVNIEDYHHLYLPDAAVTAEMISEESDAQPAAGSGVYLVRNETGSAVIDTVKETLSSEDLPAFTNVMGIIQPGMANTYLDGLPYVRWVREERTRKLSSEEVPEQPSEEAAPVTLDFAEYGIDLRGDKDGVYLPVATLSDLYSDLAYHYAFYDGRKVYFEDELRENPFFIRDSDYFGSYFAEETRPEDLAEFTYRELCFAIDHFYGFPERVTIGDTIRVKGMDRTLEEFGAAGARLKEMLQSTDKAEYLFALSGIGSLLADGGHTTIMPEFYYLIAMPDTVVDRYMEVSEANQDLFREERRGAIQALLDGLNAAAAKNQLREEIYDPEETYFKEGDTAVCVFDSFNPSDLDAFKGYLSGEEDEMPQGDPMTIFLEALSRAKADPEVKNFVVDVSGNLGGSVDLVYALTAILSGENEAKIVCQNTLDGRFYTEYYQIDTNMDGKFDEADKEVTCDLRIAILTSKVSFSCGNLFPSMMKDKGFPIIGEQSGGGSCAIQCMATADGVWYQLSSHRMHMLDGSGGQVDFGVPVDVDLVGKNPDGSDRMVTVQIDGAFLTDDGRITSDEIEVEIPDYSAFYDLKRLSEEINTFYEEQ